MRSPMSKQRRRDLWHNFPPMLSIPKMLDKIQQIPNLQGIPPRLRMRPQTTRRAIEAETKRTEIQWDPWPLI